MLNIEHVFASVVPLLCCAVYPSDHVPHMNDVEAWDRVCFGRAAADSDLQLPPVLADDSAEMTQLSPNICSKIMALEQVSRVQLGGVPGSLLNMLRLPVDAALSINCQCKRMVASAWVQPAIGIDMQLQLFNIIEMPAASQKHLRQQCL
jgi:hypothetical protein